MNAFGNGLIAGWAAAGGPSVDVGRIVRRTVVAAGIVSLVALVVGVVVGWPLGGLGVLGGSIVGAANNQAFRSRALRLMEQGTLRRRPVFSSVVVRLVVVTGLVFYLIVAVPALGWGLLFGVVAFQVVLMAVAMASLWRQRSALT